MVLYWVELVKLLFSVLDRDVKNALRERFNHLALYQRKQKSEKCTNTQNEASMVSFFLTEVVN